MRKSCEISNLNVKLMDSKTTNCTSCPDWVVDEMPIVGMVNINAVVRTHGCLTSQFMILLTCGFAITFCTIYYDFVDC